MEATWSFNGVAVPALTWEITVDRTYESGWIAFHFTRADGKTWPVGEYAVEVEINGQKLAELGSEMTVPPS